MDIAERLRLSVQDEPIYNETLKKNVHVTISVGIAHIGSGKVTMKQLIERADEALYKAKEERNKILLYII